jgi:hypothetical protein
MGEGSLQGPEDFFLAWLGEKSTARTSCCNMMQLCQHNKNLATTWVPAKTWTRKRAWTSVTVGPTTDKKHLQLWMLATSWTRPRSCTPVKGMPTTKKKHLQQLGASNSMDKGNTLDIMQQKKDTINSKYASNKNDAKKWRC